MAADEQPLHTVAGETAGDSAPRKKTCTGFCCCKVLVVIYGFLFLIIGLILLGVGIWIESVRKDYTSIYDALSSPSILAIVVGICMIITALLGIFGAIAENLVLLKVFLAVIIIVFIFQVIIGIIAFVYRGKTMDVIGSKMRFAIDSYHENEDLQRAVDAVQQKFECCGIKGMGDWNRNEKYNCKGSDVYACSVPDSCCREQLDNCGFISNVSSSTQVQRINSYGCLWFFTEWMENRLDDIGATALGFAIPQILGIFLVYTYITKVEDRIHLFKYSKYQKRFIPDLRDKA